MAGRDIHGELEMSSARPSVKSEAWNLVNRPAGIMFGLCTLETNLYCEADIGDAVIVFSCGALCQVIPAVDCANEIAPNIWRLSVNVLTHLLPNGASRFIFELKWPGGDAHGLGELEGTVDNRGVIAELVRRALTNNGNAIVLGKTVDSAAFPYHDPDTTPWFDGSEALTAVALTAAAAKDIAKARVHLAKWGFTVLPQQLGTTLINAFKTEINDAIASGKMANTPDGTERVYDVGDFQSGRKIAFSPLVLNFLRDWFRDDPCVCQSVAYLRGSLERPHQDTIHITPFPAGMMCGVLVSLEDASPETESLVLYPRSQELPRLRASELGLPKVTTDYSPYEKFLAAVDEMLKVNPIEPIVIRPNAGEIIIWHENLIRASAPPGILTHYLARGAIGYYDSRGAAAVLRCAQV
jgi:hypothetical protein